MGVQLNAWLYRTNFYVDSKFDLLLKVASFRQVVSHLLDAVVQEMVLETLEQLERFCVRHSRRRRAVFTRPISVFPRDILEPSIVQNVVKLVPGVSTCYSPIVT